MSLPRVLVRMRRRIPLFPFIPLAPLALLIGEGVAIARIHRRVCKLESRRV